jgi:tRNA(fMet)-specific endonuclease VapC
MSFLTDTDICSAYLKQNALVSNRFLQYAGRIHLSIISLGELYTWTARRHASPQRLRRLLDLLNDVTVLDADAAVAHKFGEVRAHLLDIGLSTQPTDLFIAATALVHGLIVVTHNTRHYARVPGLTVVDWMIP